jgi:hypothetical protein
LFTCNIQNWKKDIQVFALLYFIYLSLPQAFTEAKADEARVRRLAKDAEIAVGLLDRCSR